MDAQVIPVDETGERSRLPESQGVVIVTMASLREAVSAAAVATSIAGQGKYLSLLFECKSVGLVCRHM